MTNIIDQIIITQMHHLANHTMQYLDNGDLPGARQCINRTGEVYDNSNDRVKHIVANDFLYSVSLYIRTHNLESLHLLPPAFKPEYFSITPHQ